MRGGYLIIRISSDCTVDTVERVRDEISSTKAASKA